MRFFRKGKRKLARGILLAAGLFVYTWLFPQTAFLDCVRPAEKENPGQCGMPLTEEESVKLFDPVRSRFKITFFFQ